MKIERVVLNNFRQYFGSHRVAFSQDDRQNVTVIHGVNGAGKTSFFLALNWCLYGEGVDSIGQIISKEAVSRAKTGEIIVTKVDIAFMHDGQRYMASRQLRGQKKKNGSVEEARTNAEFVLMRTPMSGVATRIDNPIGVMNTILPSNVRTYFFFDGEKIDNFARPEASKEVQEAIYKVLSLETLTRAKAHLSNAARDLRGQLKGIVSDEMKDLIAEDADLREEQDELEARQSELKENIHSAQRRIDEINQKLRDFDAVQALQREYELYTQEIKARESDFAELTSRIKELASQGYIPMSVQAVTNALQLLDEKRQRGEIPSNIRQQFIEDLLEKQVCICGRPFSEHDNAHEHLTGLLKTSVPTSLEDDVLSTSGHLRALISKGNETREALNTAMQDKVRLEENIERLYRQRDDIQRQMKGSDLTEASELAKKREEYQMDIGEYQVEQGRNEARLDEIKMRIKELEKQIDKAQKSEYKERLLSRKVKLAQDAADVIDHVYEAFAEQKRQEVEAGSREIFRSLAWKGEHFQDIRLTEDYQLEVIDRYGMQARPELSAGERQVLSLSFITAMAKVAQNEAPLVMDTPFGRLSSAHREAITGRLPDLAPQLVLFVTDEELRDQALDNLRPRIGAEYRLNFNPSTSCTEIEELN